MRRTRCYLAGPYSLGDRSENVRTNILVADQLMDLGYAPYAPLLNHFSDLMFPRTYNDWLSLDLEWLHASDVMLRTPGPSKGADIEQQWAEAWGIPVVHSIAELLDRVPNWRDE